MDETMNEITQMMDEVDHSKVGNARLRIIEVYAKLRLAKALEKLADKPIPPAPTTINANVSGQINVKDIK